MDVFRFGTQRCSAPKTAPATSVLDVPFWTWLVVRNPLGVPALYFSFPPRLLTPEPSSPSHSFSWVLPDDAYDWSIFLHWLYLITLRTWRLECNEAYVALLQMRRSLSNRLEAGLNTRLTKTLRGESLILWWICAVRSTTVTWKLRSILSPFYLVQQSRFTYIYMCPVYIYDI